MVFIIVPCNIISQHGWRYPAIWVNVVQSE
jgi:hypothetical protein